MPRASDFELGLYALLNAAKGGYEAYDANRDYKLKLRRQALDEQKQDQESQLEQRRQATSEFNVMGSDMDTILRGRDVAANPALAAPAPEVRGITIGQDPLQAKADLGTYTDYVSRLKAKASRGPSVREGDKTIQSMTSELNSLERLIDPTPEDEDRKSYLRSALDKARGLQAQRTPEKKVEAPVAENPSIWSRAASAAGRALFGSPGSAGKPSSALSQVEEELARRKAKGSNPTKKPYIRER